MSQQEPSFHVLAHGGKQSNVHRPRMFLLAVRGKMATPVKGTRKTYSFEEREILITLINKYDDIEDKKSDPISMCKRKSAWSQLANEYNTMVGPQGQRSAVQLRRCWENMKACKRNREERKSRSVPDRFCYLSKDQVQPRGCNWDRMMTPGQRSLEEGPVSSGLPPNVVFEPKDSEPFTLQSVCPLRPLALNLKKEADPFSDGLQSSRTDRCQSPHEKSDSPTIELSDDSENLSERIPRRAASPGRRGRLSGGKDKELQVLAVSEARIRLDVAAMLKEEARIKLEEAHYRKEEARLRMLLFTYKLDRIKEG